jgi:hypothetical protein
LILLFHLPGTDGYHRNQRPAPHWSLQHTNTTRSQAWLTNPMYPGYIAWLGHLLKHDPQNLKLYAFGYDFFQMTTHNPGLFVWCAHMVIASHSSEVCLIFPWLRMKTKLPNLEFLQLSKVQLISLDDLNFSVQMFLSWMFAFVDFAWKDWVNLANSTWAQVILSGSLHEIYFLSTSTIWVPQQEILDMNMRISHEHRDVRLRAWSYFHLEAKMHMFRNSRKEIKEWVFKIILYKSLIPRKNQFATFFSQLIVSKFLGVTRDLGLTV